MAQITSKQSGNWSSPQTWSGPISTQDSVIINHNVVLDTNPTIAGLTINEGASLEFNNIMGLALQSSKNIVVYGLLKSTPSSQVTHTIRFIGVNESNYVGSGDILLDSDIGLWVLNNGVLNLNGTPKQSWTTAKGDILSGSTPLSVISSDGWKVGDRLMIVPTEQGASNFDEVSITSVTNNISYSPNISSHRTINNKWTAEIANLTRNIQIEGTPSGQAHVFIKSSKPQSISYVQFRYLGPRKNVAGDAAKELVVGRYALHFHHCEDGSRGTIVRGCVATQCNNHAFVPHGSHGITMRENVLYNNTETPLWYDMGHQTHNLLFDSNLVALVKYVPRAIQPEDGTPAFAAAGIILGMGDDNICINNVVVGVSGMPRTDFGGAYNWESGNEGIWKFQNNLAHHCTDGIRTWQNTSRIHIIEDYSSYYCVNGILHGAYVNVYKYNGGTHYASVITVHAGSDNTSRIRFENITMIGGGNSVGLTIEGSPVPGMLPVLVRNCTFVNCILQDIGGEQPHNVDVIQSNGQVKVTGAGETARVQPVSGTPTMITSSNITNILPFAPTLWGNGDGLKGEYFHSPNFTSPAFTRIDTVLNFQEWSGGGIHHLITDGALSVRWTGQILPQFSETYTFTVHCDLGGTGKLTVNGKQLIAANGTGTISLIAGQKYDIKLEFTSSQYAGVNLFWNSPSLDKFSKGGEYVPQSQTFSLTSTQPPVNQPPRANAGADVTLTLPNNSTILSGSGSDVDGTISAYKWDKISGPDFYIIQNPSAATTSVTGMAQGAYTFRLTVIDDKGGTGTDDVNIFVLPKPIPKPPVVSAPDVLKVISTPLQGSIQQGDAPISTMIWTQTEGPTQATITNASSLTPKIGNLKTGTYIFRFTVIDSSGQSAFDDATLTVTE